MLKAASCLETHHSKKIHNLLCFYGLVFINLYDLKTVAVNGKFSDKKEQNPQLLTYVASILIL